MNKRRFGIILTWPGIKNAESEIISRTMRAAQEIDAECVPIDNYGFVLDANYESTEKKAENLEFVLSLHYDTPKLIDAFYYHTVWNPPEIPLKFDGYRQSIDNYIMNDDYLIYDKGSMSAHLQSILLESPRNLTDASVMMGTFPKSAIMEPNLANPKLFYCGMNWDILVDKHGRNESLMKLLDTEGVVKIFGPNATTNKAWGGIHPWAGYKCYQYPIPFDGFSLLDELNKCGICLVFSSDVHRRAGAVTNRAFEACAAGAVIISDNNLLMKQMFGDAALFVDYNKNNPKDTFQQVMEKYRWILDHKKEAMTLARQSQQIFLKKYTLNAYLEKIFENHPNRLESVKTSLFSKNSQEQVHVLYVCPYSDLKRAGEAIRKVVNNVKRQIFASIYLTVALDITLNEFICEQLKDTKIKISIYPVKMFDSNKNMVLTNGQIFAQISRYINSEYFMMTDAEEYWFRDHVTTLMRTLQDSKGMLACSGQLYVDTNGIWQVKSFDRPKEKDFILYYNGKSALKTSFPCPGVFLFDKVVLNQLPQYVFDSIDGNEYLAYVYTSVLNKKTDVVFSKRMTFVCGRRADCKNKLVQPDQEMRYIQGLCRYHEIGKDDFGMWLSTIPLKPYIIIRSLRIIMRVIPKKSWLYIKIGKIYGRYCRKYFNF
jgi:hypothetical protein